LADRLVKDIPTDSRHVNAFFRGSVAYDASVQSGQNLDQKGVLGGDSMNDNLVSWWRSHIFGMLIFFFCAGSYNPIANA
jgi:hypothetical protein